MTNPIVDPHGEVCQALYETTEFSLYKLSYCFRMYHRDNGVLVASKIPGLATQRESGWQIGHGFRDDFMWKFCNELFKVQAENDKLNKEDKEKTDKLNNLVIQLVELVGEKVD